MHACRADLIVHRTKCQMKCERPPASNKLHHPPYAINNWGWNGPTVVRNVTIGHGVISPAASARARVGACVPSAAEQPAITTLLTSLPHCMQTCSARGRHARVRRAQPVWHVHGDAAPRGVCAGDRQAAVHDPALHVPWRRPLHRALGGRQRRKLGRAVRERGVHPQPQHVGHRHGWLGRVRLH